MFPILSEPVARPELVQPWTTVNVTDGSIAQLIAVYMHLTHGANYDDPAPWVAESFAGRKGSR